jgi:DNA-binding NarL/FixJ family response regulator
VESRPRLLIADDHLSFAESIGRFLASRFDVQPPVSVLADLDWALGQCCPTFLLLDIQFEPGSALDILPAIVRRTDARIMMFTARAEIQCVVRAFQAGAVGYFLKQDGLHELTHAINQLIAGVRYIAPELRPRYEALQRVRPVGLTRRQQEVLDAVRSTRTQAEAAARLGISCSTVEKMVHAIKIRLGVSDTHKWLKHDIPPAEGSVSD